VWIGEAVTGWRLPEWAPRAVDAVATAPVWLLLLLLATGKWRQDIVLLEALYAALQGAGLAMVVSAGWQQCLQALPGSSGLHQHMYMCVLGVCAARGRAGNQDKLC
jgi:hypothetical protein